MAVVAKENTYTPAGNHTSVFQLSSYTDWATRLFMKSRSWNRTYHLFQKSPTVQKSHVPVYTHTSNIFKVSLKHFSIGRLHVGLRIGYLTSLTSFNSQPPFFCIHALSSHCSSSCCALYRLCPSSALFVSLLPGHIHSSNSPLSDIIWTCSYHIVLFYSSQIGIV